MSNKWRRAVITAEAAVIIPIAAIVVAVIIGYLYYIHQNVWCTAAAYESGFHVIQAEVKPEADMCERAALHMKTRLEDSPIISLTDADCEKKDSRIISSWQLSVLPDVFGDHFSAEGKAEVRVVRASEIKRVSWMISNL